MTCSPLRAVLAQDRTGQGPPVVLVHGVGIGPWSYAGLARRLAVDHEVVVVHRRGYGRSAGLALPASLGGQVDDLADLGVGPAAFVGVSGGATLVLALAMSHPELVTAAVVHEPVVGALAPELHAQLSAAAARLAASEGEAGVLEFVRALIGPSMWQQLHPSQVAAAASCPAVVRAEVPQFLRFEPDPVQLRALGGVALVSSVGEASPASRHAAAAAVAAHTGRAPSVLPGAGHLAQLECPSALAALLRHAESLAFEGGARSHQQVFPARRGDKLHPDW